MVICIWSKHKNKSYTIKFKTNPCSKFQSITTPSSWKFSHFSLSLSLSNYPGTKWKNYRITKSVTYRRYCCYNLQRMLLRNMDWELVVFSNILLNNNNNNNNKSLNFKMNKMRSRRGLLFRLIDWQCSALYIQICREINSAPLLLLRGRLLLHLSSFVLMTSNHVGVSNIIIYIFLKLRRKILSIC